MTEAGEGDSSLRPQASDASSLSLTNLLLMEELPARFADLLEKLALKVRSLTVDRVAEWIRVGGLGILAGTLAFTALLFLLFAIFGALEIQLTTAGALALVGVLLISIGGYMWIKRT